MMVKSEYIIRDKNIWVAGHSGMVGRALLKRLEEEGCNVIIVDRKTVDLRRQTEVELSLIHI